MKNLFFLIKSKIFGIKCGQDQWGNCYFYHKSNSKKRWVIYSGNEDASKVPPDWHGWLHGYLDAPINEENPQHRLNLTGTKQAHDPCKSNSPSKGKTQIWQP